jgi:hypothetical protein
VFLLNRHTGITVLDRDGFGTMLTGVFSDAYAHGRRPLFAPAPVVMPFVPIAPLNFHNRDACRTRRTLDRDRRTGNFDNGRPVACA